MRGESRTILLLGIGHFYAVVVVAEAFFCFFVLFQVSPVLFFFRLLLKLCPPFFILLALDGFLLFPLSCLWI